MRGALESLTKARETYAATLAGSTHPDAELAAAFTARACAQISDQAAGLDLADRLLRDYLHSITGDPTTIPVPDARIEPARTALRPGVEGTQTTGWWLCRDGSRVRLRSGPDDDPNGWQQKAERFLRQKVPNASPYLFTLSRHVEIQLAIRSHEHPFEHEVIVIDRKVCGRDARTREREYTCDEYLPYILAEGASLTVVEMDGTKVTYVGKGE